MTPRRFTRLLDLFLVRVGFFPTVSSILLVSFLEVSISTGLFRSMVARAGRLKVFVRGVDSLERIGVNDALRMGVIGRLEEILRGLGGERLDRTFDGETGDGSFDWAISEGLVAFERKGETGIWLVCIGGLTPLILTVLGVLLSGVTWVLRSLVVGEDETGEIGFEHKATSG